MKEAEPSPSLLRVVGSIIWATGIVGMQVSLWLAWFCVVVKSVPHLILVLEDRDILLPIMSQQLVTMSMMTVRYWYLLVLFGFPLCLVEIILVVAADTTRVPWLKVWRYLAVALFSLAPLLLLLYTLLAQALTIYIVVKDVVPS